jgi:hypothetical protein
MQKSTFSLSRNQGDKKDGADSVSGATDKIKKPLFYLHLKSIIDSWDYRLDPVTGQWKSPKQAFRAKD